MARGVEGRPIFLSDNDRKRFIDDIRRYERQSGAVVLAYCLMNNHFHLAIKVGTVTLGDFMRRLTGGYAASFNHQYERMGHLFQSRHKAKLCLDDRYLAQVIHYIHMNPVRAGLVSHPGEWPWSSYQPTMGALPNLDGFDPWNKDAVDPILARVLAPIKSLDELGCSTAASLGLVIADLQSRYRNKKVVAARGIFVRGAIQNGHSLTAAALWLKTTRSSVSRYANNATTGGQTPS